MIWHLHLLAPRHIRERCHGNYVIPEVKLYINAETLTTSRLTILSQHNNDLWVSEVPAINTQMKILYIKSNNKSEHVWKKKNENKNSKMNSLEWQEHESEPISTWQARNQQVAGLAFLHKNKPLGAKCLRFLQMRA